MSVQYWQLGEKLFAYAPARNGRHFLVWAAINRKQKDNRAAGIWHETHTVTPEAAENIYSNMPAFGLGSALGVTAACGYLVGTRDAFAKPNS
jgi:hypothetical protein